MKDRCLSDQLLNPGEGIFMLSGDEGFTDSAKLREELGEISDYSNKVLNSLYLCWARHITHRFDLLRVSL